MVTELTTELERWLLRELLSQWKQINAAYFKETLAPPTLELTFSASILGRWTRDTRTIEMSRPFVLEHPWGAVIEVLKHEMAHQYVHEVLREESEHPHGPAFRQTCERLGIDRAAAGVPVVSDPIETKMIERVARLLALAESPNVHEAEAATAAAHRLMLKYNLEAGKSATARAYGFRHLGTPSGRIGEHDRILAMLLGKHFFVEVIWVPVYRPLEGKRGSVLEICGALSNLAIAEYVHAYLLHTSEELWNEHKRAHKIAGNRDRRVFLVGVMAGFAEKLARQATHHREEGMVWLKDADLSGFFRRRHPYVRNVRHAGTRKNEAFSHGREAGRQINIRRGVEAAATTRGRMLPS
jgi:predicted SprT family Zn-dependent metalloprotease